MQVAAMMPPIPRSETTNPKPWQAVTAMVGCSVDTGHHRPEGQHSSERVECRERVFWDRLVHTSQMGHEMEEGTQQCHLGSACSFIYLGEIISATWYQDPFVFHHMYTLLAVYLLREFLS